MHIFEKSIALVKPAIMKKVLLTLAAMVLFVPSQLNAAPEAVAAPVDSSVSVATPVDDLIQILTPFMKLAFELEAAGDNVSMEQVGKALELYGKLQTLQKDHGEYRLTDSDRDKLMNWAKKFSNEILGESMSAEDVAEARAELNSYKTLNDFLGDMDLNGMFN